MRTEYEIRNDLEMSEANLRAATEKEDALVYIDLVKKFLDELEAVLK